MWPLGIISYFFSSPYALLVIQDVGTSLTTLVSFLWISDYLNSRDKFYILKPEHYLLIGTVILVADPWPLWSLAFDYHAETLAGLTVILTAYAFYKGDKKLGVFWAFVTLLTGDVGTTYLAGIGISMLLVNLRHFKVKYHRREIYWALGLLVGSSVYLSIVHAIGGDQGGGLDSYAYLAYPLGHYPKNFNLVDLIVGALKNPRPFFNVLWQRRANLYANVAPLGLIGFFTPWGFGVPLILELENGLHIYAFFSVPGFQSEPIYGFVAFGTIVALYNIAKFCAKLAKLISRYSRKVIKLPKIIGFLLGLNAVIWGAIWYPAAVPHWLRVDTRSAQVVDQIYPKIKPQDEVFVTQGVTGRFADRQWEYPIMGAGAYGYVIVRKTAGWWVITPFVGTEISYTAVDLGIISDLVDNYGGKVVVAKDNIWAIRTPANDPFIKGNEVYFSLTPTMLKAWTFRTTVGHRVLKGPVNTWVMQASSPPNHPISGYVDWGDYWQYGPGQFQASITLSSTVPGGIKFEAWDADTNILLMQRSIPPTNGVKTFTFNFSLSPLDMKPENVFSGWGLFSTYPIPPPSGNRIELRVWTPGGGTVDVYQQGLSCPQDQDACTPPFTY